MKTQINKKVFPKNIEIAHRGLWDENIPENSLGAFKRSIEKNISIELDIHLTKDNELVVFHDDNLKRMTGENKLVKNSTLKEIKALKLNNTNYKIPTLEEVLDLVQGKVLIDIEIKIDVKSFKICKKLKETLNSYKGDVFIKSFNPIFISWFRFNAPLYKRGLLVSSLKHTKINPLIKFVCFHMYLNFLCKPDFIAFDIRDLPNKKIDKLYKKSVPIYLWTIRDGTKLDNTYYGIIYEKKH